MDFKKLGTFIIAIGVIILVGSGIFYAANMGKSVDGNVAFLAGFGNKQAQEIWAKQENRETAKKGLIPGVIVTIVGVGIFMSVKGSNPKT